MQKKLVVLYIAVLLAFVGLSARLILINKEDGESYKRQVLSQQSYESKVLPFKRGDIIDAKGSKLAVSEKVYNVVLDVKLMNEKKEYAEPTIGALTSCFGLSGAEIREYAKENPTSQYHVLAKRLSYEQISKFLDLQNDEEKGKNIQGVWFEEEYKRVYPNDTLASTVIGFMGKDDGAYGLEEYYNDTLNGVSGREYGYLNDDSTLERTTKAATDGDSLVLTVDANIQSIVERCLKEYNEEYTNSVVDGPGYKNAGCIIMDIHNGDILAMADSSGFNPNDPKDPQALLGKFLVDGEGKTTDELVTQEIIDSDFVSDNNLLYQNLNNEWKNFCISNTYEPGSVAKPFTVATGLESGAIAENATYDCGGFLMVGGHRIRCHTRAGDGTLTLGEAVERSCNVAMMHIGEAVGKDRFLEYQSNFNFGLKTNIDLAGEARTAGLMFTNDTMGPAELATSTFGQGFNVTMIQTISAFASLINGGYYYEPHVVKKIVNSEGATVKNIEPRLLKQTVSAHTSEKIIEYCNQVVSGEHGTGKTARPAGYMIGGKTGTAETVPRGNHKYVVSFMGYAPAVDPQILIYVVVQEGNGDREGDAKHATRIVRNVLTEVLPYLNIFMTEELSDEERAELEARRLAITGGAQVSGNDVSGNDVSGNEGGAAGGGEGKTEENTAGEEKEIDPASGYRMDEEGKLVDAESGEPAEQTSVLDGITGAAKDAGEDTCAENAKDIMSELGDTAE